MPSVWKRWRRCSHRCLRLSLDPAQAGQFQALIETLSDPAGCGTPYVAHKYRPEEIKR